MVNPRSDYTVETSFEGFVASILNLMLVLALTTGSKVIWGMDDLKLECALVRLQRKEGDRLRKERL